MAIKQLPREWRDHIRLLQLREKWREAKKYRFSEEIRNKQMRFDMNRLPWEKLGDHFDLLYTEITDETVDEFISRFLVLE